METKNWKTVEAIDLLNGKLIVSAKADSLGIMVAAENKCTLPSQG